jgi:hypothetical protein
MNFSPGQARNAFTPRFRRGTAVQLANRPQPKVGILSVRGDHAQPTPIDSSNGTMRPELLEFDGQESRVAGPGFEPALAAAAGHHRRVVSADPNAPDGSVVGNTRRIPRSVGSAAFRAFPPTSFRTLTKNRPPQVRFFVPKRRISNRARTVSLRATNGSQNPPGALRAGPPSERRSKSCLPSYRNRPGRLP